MNIKTIFYVLIAIASTVNIYSSQTNGQSPHRPLSAEEWRRLEQDFMDRSKPRDKTKTPTSSDVIEHDGGNMKFGGSNFYRKRIYFGTLESGEPHYARIWEHERNPDFNKVPLIVRKKASIISRLLSYISFLNINTDDYFEFVGTFGDEAARRQLINSIPVNGGLWCPDPKDPTKGFFVGGTREMGACDKLRDDFKKLEQQVESQQKEFEQQVKLQQKIFKI